MNLCTARGCVRSARSSKAVLCNTHYERQRRGVEPRLPVAPLLAFAKTRGVILEDMPSKDMALGRADEICCNTLGVHPYDVYGNAYFHAA